jgi:hypothetical protein
MEVAIDKCTQSPIIIHGARAAASADVKLKVRDAESILEIDQKQCRSIGILGGGLDPMLVYPGFRFGSALLVGDPPDGSYRAGIKKGRYREC